MADKRIIIHIDYDSFYASVVENEQPELRGLPLGIQQKSILATCNYVARSRGVRKLQSISEARKVCQDLVIINGEDLTRFRNASKKLWLYVREIIWGHCTERLGFDEIFCDVTTMVEFNLPMANQPLKDGFFRLSLNDETQGFPFSWIDLPGHTFPSDRSLDILDRSLPHLEVVFHQKLFLACHLANFIRRSIFEKFHHTASAGISTNKLTAKLVGSINKPNQQTVLNPALTQLFLDSYEIGKIPGIGFKISQKLRDEIHGISQDASRVHNKVTVEQARKTLDRRKITKLVGSSQLAENIYGWLHGIDASPVLPAPLVPTQISIEDTFRSLESTSQLIQVLKRLTAKLIERMRVDLLLDHTRNDTLSNPPKSSIHSTLKWMAYPRNFRLSIRSMNARQFSRISKSTLMPRYVFDTIISPEVLADKLVKKIVMPLFKKLHPSEDINLQLVNVAAVNMSEELWGEDIGTMFNSGNTSHLGKKYEDATRDDIEMEVMRIEEVYETHATESVTGFTDGQDEESNYDDDVLVSDGSESLEGNECLGDVPCPRCGALLPIFVVEAHNRFHDLEEKS